MNKRRNFSANFKTKVVLEALLERSTLAELGQKYSLQPTQISKWKHDFVSNASDVFEKGGSKKENSDQEKEKLYKIIGQQKVELDFLKDALS